jgi:hypothetical protein
LTVDPAELVRAEASYLEAQAEVLRRRAAELRDLLKDGRDEGVVAQLEALPWVAARSGKCDYVKDAPLQLVEAVRASKGGVRGDVHHFTASATEPTLFRFARKGGGAEASDTDDHSPGRQPGPA